MPVGTLDRDATHLPRLLACLGIVLVIIYGRLRNGKWNIAEHRRCFPLAEFYTFRARLMSGLSPTRQ